MKRFAAVALGLAAGFAIVAGCRGSVDRVFDDALSEGGPRLDDSGIIDKQHFDAASLSDATPATAAAHIKLTVRGLEGSGLVLQNNGDDDLPVAANGAYTFNTPIPPGQPYKVTVANQPTGPSQSCVVTKGEGTAAGLDVGDVSVDCTTATFPVGGTVVGLGAGKSVTLQNNGGADVIVNGDGPFTFPGVQSGKSFNVSIKSSTAGTTCNVSGGTGTVGTAAVDSVVVNCGANTYTVGGNVTGLTGTLVITNNGGNDRTISANGSFAFSTPISNGAPYKVEVKTQPAYPPQAQTCTVTSGTGTVGTSNVTNVAINCTTTKFTVGGTVNGLTAAGLKLQNNGGDDKSINAPGGSFTFATQIGSGSSYNATVITQPSGQTCTVSNPSGTVTTATVNSIVVNCATPIPLSENFDGVVAPSLPNGWTSVSLLGAGPVGALAKWTTDPSPGGNSAFTPDPSHKVDVALVSPAFNVSSTTAKLTFTHVIDSEEDWDGGVLEINVAGAGWKDIIAAGGSFTSGGYNTPQLLYDGANPLAVPPGRPAWSGKASGTVVANLPVNAAGKSVQLRWRFGADDDTPVDGWHIDNVVVTN